VAPSNPHPTGAVHELNLYRKTGDGPAPFEVLPLPLPETHRGIEGANQWIQVGDFNGDGKADYLLFLTGVATAARVFIGSSTSSGWTCTQLTTSDNLTIPLAEWRNAGATQVLDFDGDGSQELLLVKGSVAEIYRFTNNVVHRV